MLSRARRRTFPQRRRDSPGLGIGWCSSPRARGAFVRELLLGFWGRMVFVVEGFSCLSWMVFWARFLPRFGLSHWFFLVVQKFDFLAVVCLCGFWLGRLGWWNNGRSKCIASHHNLRGDNGIFENVEGWYAMIRVICKLTRTDERLLVNVVKSSQPCLCFSHAAVDEVVQHVWLLCYSFCMDTDRPSLTANVEYE